MLIIATIKTMLVTHLNLQRQILVLFLTHIMYWLHMRIFIYGLKRYQLNNSAYKKRKKGEAFKEWLFYSRYKEEIPKPILYMHHSILFRHPAAMIACIFLYLANMPSSIGSLISGGIVFFGFWEGLVLKLLFFDPHIHGNTDYSRFIKKRRGQTKGSKK